MSRWSASCSLGPRHGHTGASGELSGGESFEVKLGSRGKCSEYKHRIIFSPICDLMALFLDNSDTVKWQLQTGHVALASSQVSMHLEQKM